MTSTLVGASSVEQLEANVKALERPDFTEDELAEIDRYATESDINLWSDRATGRGQTTLASILHKRVLHPRLPPHREIFTGTYASDMGPWTPDAGRAMRYRERLHRSDLALLYNVSAEFAYSLDQLAAARPRAFGGVFQYSGRRPRLRPDHSG